MKTNVKPANSIVKAISFGVFLRDAPSTRAIILSKKLSPGCVVTNTFHGTVFAIIHHKPFLCILQRGSSANQNTRMSSLLSTLGLEDRILNCEDSIEVSINRPINWQKVSTLITDWRKKSDAFLNFLND